MPFSSGALVARTGLDPDAQRHRLEMRHVVGDHVEAVGKTGDLDAHACHFSQGTCRWRMKSRTASASLGSTVKRSAAVEQALQALW